MSILKPWALSGAIGLALVLPGVPSVSAQERSEIAAPSTANESVPAAKADAEKGASEDTAERSAQVENNPQPSEKVTDATSSETATDAASQDEKKGATSTEAARPAPSSQTEDTVAKETSAHTAEAKGASAPENANAAVKGSEAPATETTQAEKPTEDADAQRSAAGAAPENVPVDPLVAAVRQFLSDDSDGGAKNREDIAALVAFYAARDGRALWVGGSGFTSKAKAVMAEIAHAADWGLEAEDFSLPPSNLVQSGVGGQAEAEIKLGLAVLKYVNYARGGRVTPSRVSSQIDQDPELKEPAVVLSEIAAASDGARYLREQHPPHPQFEMLRQALLKLRGEQDDAEKELSEAKKVKLPDGPLLRPGLEHPHVALLRRRLEVTAEPGAEEKFDEPLEEAVRAFQRAHDLSTDGLVGRGTRAVLNGNKSDRSGRAKARAEERLIVNMERWRWMPRNLGAFHVLNNVPEFQTRVFKNGSEIFSERIIVGKTDTRTPVFSADMKYVIFHPSWGVPNGIKRTEILPYLRQKTGLFGFGGSDTRILTAHNLSVSYQGRPVDASQINWTSANIVNYDFIQPPGPTNVLGRVKFRFPNRHDVYMHDTPERELFAQSSRALSHGCVRVRNPRRLAEVLLAEDKGWSEDEVGRRWSGAANGYVELEKKIPVHTAYFTAYASENGEVRYFPDLYGFDSRTARAMGGNGSVFEGERIPQSAPSRRSAPAVAQGGGGYSGSPETVADLISGLLSN
ncbi:Murein L,D-transpeptidase YcbB/YkuD [Filomicrobium insigne]|uniref:Murein L,D-transpeptidase YcbB/YkuD n=1 Tax=Filomicrobium insigne TaxID=418854 RepID=A0A1H0L9N5_9HYPH|nr:L,D-transpeptidase family protein [Filomicrobium insigne]SDO64660.1 Murein L,D-transpeptidase YcbB/YkuD [Filomicrobium insigne]